MGKISYIEVVLLCIIVLCISFYQILSTMDDRRQKRPLVILYLTVILFCVTDFFWGLTFYRVVDLPRFWSFFASYALNAMGCVVPYIWFRYTERYLETPHSKSSWGIVVDGCLLYVQIVFLIINFKTDCIFSIDADGVYSRGTLSWIPFALGFAYFIMAALRSFCWLFAEKDRRERKRCRNAVIFSLLPIVTGFFQYIFYDEPFLSMGFMLACILIYMLNVTSAREQHLKEAHKRVVDEQLAVIGVLTSDFTFVAKINLDREEMQIFRRSDRISKESSERFTKREFDKSIDELTSRYVCANDRDYVEKALQADTIRRALKENSSHHINCRLDLDGMLQYYQIKIVADSSEPGDFSFIIGLHSIDDQMKKEYEQQQKLEEACAEAEEASLAKSEFLSRMSHDIRTPINGIVGMIEILKKSADDPEKLSEGLAKIDGASHHLLSLVNDVLDMSRIENNKVEIQSKPMNLKEVAETCVSVVTGQLADRSIDFKTDFASVLHRYLIGDEIHLRQVLLNILGNAVKFTPDGGAISFTVKELGIANMVANIRFEIADTGIGMSEEFLEHIWDRFSQENNSYARTDYSGTGLGMTITKSFVDLMGGTIDVQSAPGRGTVFAIEMAFPINKNPVLKSEEENRKNNLVGAHILVVEDNELNREIAQTILEESGMIVTCAEDGRQGLEAFEASETDFFDAILMDIRMPVMDGLECTKAIRATGRRDARTVPIIAMTANAFEEDIKKSLDAGMNEHLAKPIEVPVLMRVLSSFVSR